ncbi:MAG TPA: M23 family metallopeptidase [Mariprofundaceae bacterium]|nr:M23 family metallopeptidase [Mariprofundaceae bacterium]
MKHYSLMLVPDQGPIRSFAISSRSLLVAASVFFLLVVFGCWGIYGLSRVGQQANALDLAKQMLAAEKAQNAAEVDQLRERLLAEQKKMTVYARSLGQIQARLSRLDSLGSKLVDVAALNKSEFDFGLQPAFGGPRIVQPSLSGLEDHMSDNLRFLDQRLGRLDAQLSVINYSLQEKRSEANAKPHAWPTEGGWISSHYGQRMDPFTGEPARHEGVDIANRFGAPVLAAGRGVVTFAGKMTDFGYMVDIDHGYGYATRYGHLSGITVKPGDIVEDGQLIGRIGSTGRSTGPHLHYEVHRYGQHIDPASFLPRS